MPTRVHIVKAMVVPIVMYESKSWTIKKSEHQQIDAFELWYWRRHLRVPWTARRSNQLILKEIGPEYSVEVLMLKLKLQYFGSLIWRADSLGKILMLGKTEDRRRRGQQKMRWLDGITYSMAQWTWVWATLDDGEGQGSRVCCSQWSHKESDKTGGLNNNKVWNGMFLLPALPVNKPFRNADSYAQVEQSQLFTSHQLLPHW